MQFWLNAAISMLLATYSVNGMKRLNDTCGVEQSEKVLCCIMKKLVRLIIKPKPSINKPSKKPGIGPGQRSCREIYDKGWTQENKAYTLNVASMKIPVYCHMTSSGLGSCGGGGWTLVMKINGAKRTFHYDSKLWTNKESFNLPGGKTLLDHHETKLPTYWSTPFAKICLAMKIGDQVKSIVINKLAICLHCLIADGKYRPTSLGRDTWKKLIGQQASLQKNCNREGFNAMPNSHMSKARIGISSNNENNCNSPDSRIGFGTSGYPDTHNTCGNVARHGGDNGDKSIKAMGYILVQ